MNKIVLNIINDDKFTPFLQGLFEEVAPENSVFRVITNNKKLVFAVQNQSTEAVDDTYFVSSKFKKDLENTTCVIFHTLTLEYALAALRIPHHIPIVWRGWGFDYYPYLEAKGLNLLLPATRQMVKKPTILNRFLIKRTPKQLLLSLLSRTVKSFVIKSFISRVDYFSCCVPDDFEALKQVLPDFKAQFLPLNYYSIEDVFLRGDNIHDLSGNNILLGNSATPTNNHFEAISMLSELGMQGRKVIVPLSYGDEDYRKSVIRFGEKLLGESFVPLTNFVSLPEYNRIVSSCSNVIMNHVRQQGIGNISATLLRGGKVFLQQENSIYQYYTRMGVKLFTCPGDLIIDNLDMKINHSDLVKNKEIMTRIWSREQGLINVKNIIEMEK